eukprot:2638126-Rhodomonas_salina.2
MQSGYLLGKKFENVGVIYGSAQESVFRKSELYHFTRPHLLTPFRPRCIEPHTQPPVMARRITTDQQTRTNADCVSVR